MLRVPLFLPVLLGALSLTSVSAAQTPPLKIAATLPRLFPLPEDTFSPNTELTMGLKNDLPNKAAQSP